MDAHASLAGPDVTTLPPISIVCRNSIGACATPAYGLSAKLDEFHKYFCVVGPLLLPENSEARSKFSEGLDVRHRNLAEVAEQIAQFEFDGASKSTSARFGDTDSR